MVAVAVTQGNPHTVRHFKRCERQGLCVVCVSPQCLDYGVPANGGIEAGGRGG